MKALSFTYLNLNSEVIADVGLVSKMNCSPVVKICQADLEKQIQCFLSIDFWRSKLVAVTGYHSNHMINIPGSYHGSPSIHSFRKNARFTLEFCKKFTQNTKPTTNYYKCC